MNYPIIMDVGKNMAVKKESLYFEYKEKLNKKDWHEWLKTFCAFSNTEGGDLYLGYGNEGKFVGIDKNEYDKQLLYVNQIVRDHTSPIVKYEAKSIDDNGKLCGIIFHIDKRPNCITWLLINQNQNPIMYIRSQNSSVQATIEEMQDALISTSNFEFDASITGIKYEKNNFSDLEQTYSSQNNGTILTKRDMKSLNLIDNDDYLTIAGLLFMDKSPYKNANVICNTWPTNNKGTNDYVDSETLTGSILYLVEQMINYVMSVDHYVFGGMVSGKYRKEIGSFSTRGLREAFINAVAHRDYKINGNEIILDCYPDRIEITSPGSTLQKKEETICEKLSPVHSIRRNKTICDVLVKCKLMEEKGSGFDKILEEYRDYDENYAPLFTNTRTSFTLILKNKKYDYGINNITSINAILKRYPYDKPMFKTRSEIYLSNEKIKFLEMEIAKNPYITYEDLGDKFNMTHEGIKYYIRLMKEACLIRRTGTKKSGKYEIVKDINRPADFLRLDPDMQTKVIKWCKRFFIHSRTFASTDTSYGLKHILQDFDNTYLTNGQFKGAMVIAGFETKNVEDLNWVFNISKKSAAFGLREASYRRELTYEGVMNILKDLDNKK